MSDAEAAATPPACAHTSHPGRRAATPGPSPSAPPGADADTARLAALHCVQGTANNREMSAGLAGRRLADARPAKGGVGAGLVLSRRIPRGVRGARGRRFGPGTI